MFENIKKLNNFLNKPLSEHFGGVGTKVVASGKAISGAISSKRRSDAKAQHQVAIAVATVAKKAWKNGHHSTTPIKQKVGPVTVTFEESECQLWVHAPKAKVDAVSDALAICEINHSRMKIEKTMMRIDDSVEDIADKADDIRVLALSLKCGAL